MIDFGKIVARFRRTVDLTREFTAYKSVFGVEMARKIVLPDLIQYSGICAPSPETSDLFAQGRAAGRRDMMLRIQYHLNLREEDIFEMLKSNPFKEIPNAR